MISQILQFIFFEKRLEPKELAQHLGITFLPVILESQENWTELKRIKYWCRTSRICMSESSGLQWLVLFKKGIFFSFFFFFFLYFIQHCFVCRPSDSTVSEDAGIEPRAGIFKKSMGARNWGGRGLSYRPAWLHRLADFIPWNRFLGSINV